MKKFNKLSFAAFILLFSANCLYAKLKVAPYYSLDLTEGLSLPSKGGSMFTLNITNDS